MNASTGGLEYPSSDGSSSPSPSTRPARINDPSRCSELAFHAATAINYNDCPPLPPPSVRPELRVITQPGCYTFSLHSGAATSSAIDGPPSSTYTSSPASNCTTPSPTAPAFSIYQTSAHSTLHPPPALPKLLTDPFRFPQPHSMQSVSIPAATDLEVKTHCARRDDAPAPTTRVRTRARPTPKALSPTSSTSTIEDSSSEGSASPASSRALAHPYARIYAKRDSPPTKRRKMWNHALEKSLFTADELANLRAPLRRTVYIASLEAHIDGLHNQLLELQLYPVPFEALDAYHGLNSKTAKSMVAGLFKDATEERTKLLELKRANNDLRERLEAATAERPPALRRHSIDGASYAYPNIFDGQNSTVVIS